MKRLIALLILLLVGSWSQPAGAQTADSWVSVSLKGEELTVWMPKTHDVKTREFSFDQFRLNGRVYTATSEGVDLSVWSLVDKRGADYGPEASGAYLDACADLVWESLLKPNRDTLPKELKLASRMSFEEGLLLDNLPPGREYAIMLGGRRGVTQFFVAERQIYVLIGLNLDTKNVATAQRFFFSFGPKRAAPPATDLGYARGGGEIGPGVGPGIGPGQGGPIGGGDAPSTAANGSTDYNRIFSGKEITQKARILSKAEPPYTERARKYSVHGTVVLRAVFSSSGQVTNIRAVRGLPHGLTLRAIEAAKGIKFIPAQKDGHAVSMYMQLEYNFRLY